MLSGAKVQVFGQLKEKLYILRHSMHVCRRTLCVYSVYVLSRVYIQYIPGGIPGPPLHYLGSMMYRCLVTSQCTFHWSPPKATQHLTWCIRPSFLETFDWFREPSKLFLRFSSVRGISTAHFSNAGVNWDKIAILLEHIVKKIIQLDPPPNIKKLWFDNITAKLLNDCQKWLSLNWIRN